MARKKRRSSARKAAAKAAQAKSSPDKFASATGEETSMAVNRQKVGANVENNNPSDELDASLAVERVARIRSFFAPWMQNAFFWFLVVIVATPALVGPYGQSGGYTPDLHMASYVQVLSFLLLTLLAIACFRLKEDHFDVIRSPIVLPALLLYLYALLSIFWAHTKYDAVVDALDWTGAFLTGFLILLLVRNYTSMHWLVFSLYISGLLIALLGVGQYLFGIDWVQQHVVPATTFSNKNMAGQYGVLTLPLGLILFFQARKRSEIWLSAIGSAFIISFIYYTRARGSWVASATEAFLLLAFLGYVRWGRGIVLLAGREKKIALLTAALFTFLLCSLTPETVSDLSSPIEKLKSYVSEQKEYEERFATESGLRTAKMVFGGASFSANKRITMWINSLPMFIDHFFFGVGLGNWRVFYPTYQEWFWPDWELHKNLYHANAHNDYVEIVSELGLFGSIFFFWLIVAFFRTWIYVTRRLTEENFIILGPVIATIGISVSSMFSFPLKQPVPILFVLTYMALISCCYSFLQSSGSKAHYKVPYKGTVTRYAAAAVLFVTTIFMFVYHYNLYISELNYRASVSSLNAKQYRNSYQAAVRAMQHNPMRTELLWLEGTSQLRLGDTDSAIENYKKVLAAYPNSSNTLNNLATAYSIKGDTFSSIGTYQKLISLQPSNMKQKFNYVRMLIRLGYNKQAEPYLNEVLQYSLARQATGRRWWEKEKERLLSLGRVARRPLLLTALEKRVKWMEKWKKKIEEE